MKNIFSKSICGLFLLSFALALPALAQEEGEEKKAEQTQAEKKEKPKAEKAKAEEKADGQEKAEKKEPTKAEASSKGEMKAKEYIEELTEVKEVKQEPCNKPKCPVKKEHKWIDVGALMQSVFIWKNDSDFDRSLPKYDKYGNSVGAFATIFQPHVTFNIEDMFKIYYEVEVGLNVWSLNNPDQQDPTADDRFFMKHREMWASGGFMSDMLGFKVGYQNYIDPTGLFINHWLGAATIYFNLPDRGKAERKLYFTVGQLPDTTYEGMSITETNFKFDTFFFVLGTNQSAGKFLTINGGLLALLDNHLVDRSLWLISPALNLDFKFGRHTVALDAILQAGKSDAGANDEKVTHISWAAQANSSLDFKHVGLYINALVLSGDDEHTRNNFEGSFFYSGKNKSSTVLLTEDELRDRNDNYDELMADQEGGFFLTRPGMFIGDVKLEGRVGRFFRPALIIGASTVLKPEQAFDNTFVGAEFDLDLGFKYKEIMTFHLIGGMFIPGKAASYHINYIDSEATDKVFFVTSALDVKF